MDPAEPDAVPVGPGAAEELRGRELVDAHELSWALWAVLHSADLAQHAVARAMGLPQMDALALDHVLTAPDPLGPAELGRRLGITRASSTVLVDRLVAAGHLAREPHPTDRRRRVLVATDKARTEAATAMHPLLHALDEVAGRLGPSQATAVAAYLREVADVHRRYATAGLQEPAAEA